MKCIGTNKRKKWENQRARKEIGEILHINKLVQLLFAFLGL